MKNIHLTKRQLQFIAAASEGLDNAKIAEKLGVTLSTVKGTFRLIFDVMGVDSRLEMVVFARHHGLTKNGGMMIGWTKAQQELILRALRGEMVKEDKALALELANVIAQRRINHQCDCVCHKSKLKLKTTGE